MEIIEKRVPINDKNNKKKIFYSFKDNLFNFYYTFIYRNKSINNILSSEDFFNEIVKEKLYTSYLPKVFEEISKEFLIRKNSQHLLPTLFYEIGTYFFNDSISKTNRQFDVVTKDKYGFVSYECKFTSSLKEKDIKEEIDQVKNLNIDFYNLGFISKEKYQPTKEYQNYTFLSIEDFYK